MALTGDFGQQVRKMVELTKLDTEEIIQRVCIMAINNVIRMSPVGNPELWKVNSDAVAYNRAVSDYNREMRSDPSNLTAAGRLKKGIKENDSMEIKKPKGYRGGRFRGNWQVTIGVPSEGETGIIDPSGAIAKQAANDVIMSFKVGVAKYIYFCNNVPYAMPLEYGHSTQAPEGMVRITAMQFNQMVSEAAQQVRKK